MIEYKNYREKMFKEICKIKDEQYLADEIIDNLLILIGGQNGNDETEN